MGKRNSSSRSSKPSILIVDDDFGMLRTTSLILQRKGYDVNTARNGQEAIVKVKTQPFDVIFMDIKMPVMDGVETYRRIKEIRPDAVVMMMTAYAVEDLVQQALEEGAYGILYKPFDIEKIVEVIDESRKANKGALIMVVDDDEATCNTLMSILNRKGYQVGIANTGEEAIAKVQENGFDILFIDIKLPTINGLETYLAIRKINPEVVTVMITAYRQEVADLVEIALRSHAYACLYKPIEIEEMLHIVQEICARREDRD